MKLPKNQPFWTSVILHVVVLLGFFLVTIVQAFRPKETPHVFQMVEPPAEQQVETSSPSQEVTPPTDVAPLDLPPVPDVAERPAPRPEPVATQPTPKPKPQRITAAEFFRDNPRQQPRQQVTQPRREITVPQIDVPRLVVPSSPSPSRPSPDRLTPQQISALGSYSAQLRSRIDAAWGKPSGLAGVRLSATVVFDVSASGLVTNARLRPSSGNATFDQSVLAAFRRVTSAGPTPTRQGHSFTMTFRMSD